MGSSPSPPEAPAYLRISHVNVFVRDQDRSLRFYLDQLGFTLTLDAHLQSGKRIVSVAPADGSTVLRLVAPDPGSAECDLIGQPTRVVFVTDDVLARFREWSSRGVRFLSMPRLKRIRYERQAPDRRTLDPSMVVGDQEPLWGGIFARFEDIDRNSFALVSFDEETKAVEAQRRALAEKLEAERRAAQELEIATQVQARLFPQASPFSRTLDYAGCCIQARQVGGDYYDFLSLGHDRLGLVLADISGKGIAAALLMANLQANLRSQCAIALDQPERFLESANKLFHQNTGDSSYATLFFAEYDGVSRRLRYANCGHLAGLLVRCDDTLERLESTCSVMGLFENWCCSIRELDLGAGDTLVLYTDGVTESTNDCGDEFGEQRLIEALRRHRHMSPQDLLAAVLSEVQPFSSHEQHDDITLIVARCREE